MKTKINTRMLTETALIAALYTALTVAFEPLSYGAVQVRFSEALMLLCCFRKRWCAALSIGCMIANLFSGIALDFIFGTFATVLAAVLMYIIRKPAPASFIPAVVNGIIIGAELHYFMGEPFWFSLIGVAAGELIAVSAFGLPLLWALMRSPSARRIICGTAQTASAQDT